MASAGVVRVIKCNCGSDNVAVVDVKVSFNSACEQYRCKSCGRKWSKTYDLRRGVM